MKEILLRTDVNCYENIADWLVHVVGISRDMLRNSRMYSSNPPADHEVLRPLGVSLLVLYQLCTTGVFSTYDTVGLAFE